MSGTPASRGRTVVVERLTLRLPAGQARNARRIAREIGKALGADGGPSESRARLDAVTTGPRAGEADAAFAQRVATAVKSRTNGGSGDAG